MHNCQVTILYVTTLELKKEDSRIPYLLHHYKIDAYELQVLKTHMIY